MYSKRLTYILKLLIALCLILCFRIIHLNVVEGEYYKNVEKNSIYKNIIMPAPRGEIRDKNGILLAGSKPVFTVSVSKNDKISAEEFNNIALTLSNILISNNENIKDGFPINIKDGNFTYTYDEQVSRWKKENGIPQTADAKTAFEQVAQHFIDLYPTYGLTLDSDPAVIQKTLNDSGIYPPISILKGFEFTKIEEKYQWLSKYGITDKKTSAKEAFKILRKYKKIDPELSDDDARKILVISDAIVSKAYLQYEPALISKDISQKTVSSIMERKVELKNVDVRVEPLRYYPQGSLAAHIIGQIGKISSNDENLLDDERYSKQDYVGKSGIELYNESELKGINGYEKVLVDSVGKKISDIDSKESTAGDTVYLSIDAKLQKVAEDSLKKTLEKLQTGGIYDSSWGDKLMRSTNRIYNHATSGAIVALDVKTGKVLAMASYPAYDPNIFTDSMTIDEYNSLLPDNPNDPLCAKPLLNVATMTAVQPGSIFKMISALAALENGLDPNYTIEDKGVITIAGVPFKNWLYGATGKLQGNENVVTALRDSNNYFFYCISVAYNYALDQPIPMGDMQNGQKILDMAKKFGLDEKTGVEIYESSGKIPDPTEKYKSQIALMSSQVAIAMKNSFKDITPTKNEKEYERRIGVIKSWVDENPSRAEIIKRLYELRVKDEKLEETADLLKYTYFNRAKWSTGDIFNMVIGQGSHQYTPIQMANYISALVNGGYLNKVSVLDKIEDKKTGSIKVIEPVSKKIEINNPHNLEYLQRGMIDVSDEGTAKDIFANFPIKVAAKTGTAETQGKIPTKNEVEYYMSHLNDYGVNEKDVTELADKLAKQYNYAQKREYYIQLAIMELNPQMTLDKLNRFKETYADFAWFVAYAPYDDPQIAVVTLLFQGGSGSYAGPATRDVIAQYMGIYDKPVELNDEKESLRIKSEQETGNTQRVNQDDLPTQNIYSPTAPQNTQRYTPQINESIQIQPEIQPPSEPTPPPSEQQGGQLPDEPAPDDQAPPYEPVIPPDVMSEPPAQNTNEQRTDDENESPIF